MFARSIQSKLSGFFTPVAATTCVQNGPRSPLPAEPRIALTEVRHERGRRWPKWFRISSGYCRVCTTFALKSKMFRQADSELPEQRLLLCRRLGDSPQSDLATVGSGQNDVGALQGGEQRDGPHRRHGLGVIDAACRWRRHNRRPALEQMFQCDP